MTPTAHEAAAIAAITVSNIVINRARSRLSATAAAVGSAACMLVLAKAAGATAAEQGLDVRNAPRGLLTGLLVGGAVAAGIAIGAYLPPTRRFYQDQQIVATGTGPAAYELLVRIPIVTAGGEELVFRSAFEGVLSQRRSPVYATLVSAVVFGAWHILPTFDRVHSNPGVAETHRGSLAIQGTIVAAACAATAVASLGLSWLRRRTGSVLAPIAVHYAVNAGGFAAGWIAARQSTNERDHPVIESAAGNIA